MEYTDGKVNMLGDFEKQLSSFRKISIFWMGQALTSMCHKLFFLSESLLARKTSGAWPVSLIAPAAVN